MFNKSNEEDVPLPIPGENTLLLLGKTLFLFLSLSLSLSFGSTHWKKESPRIAEGEETETYLVVSLPKRMWFSPDLLLRAHRNNFLVKHQTVAMGM